MTAALSGAVVHTSDERSEPSAGPDGLQTERWAGLAAAVLLAEGVAHGEMGLRFVDPATMAELNLNHMDSPGPTDVLAFPIDGRSGRVHLPEQVPLLGDVVVCPAYARRAGPGPCRRRTCRQPRRRAGPAGRARRPARAGVRPPVRHGCRGHAGPGAATAGLSPPASVTSPQAPDGRPSRRAARNGGAATDPTAAEGTRRPGAAERRRWRFSAGVGPYRRVARQRGRVDRPDRRRGRGRNH